MIVNLKQEMQDPALEAMNFLNEVVGRYPNAVSFAPGRPLDRFIRKDELEGTLDTYLSYRAKQNGRTVEAEFLDLGQYGPANGVINDLLAKYLARDEGIQVQAADIMVTCGCQEVMAVLLIGLFDPIRDVLLTTDPTYVGITHLAKMLGIPVMALPTKEDGPDPTDIQTAIQSLADRGRRARAFYLIPTFDNPSGQCVSPSRRRQLLDLAADNEFLIFEDNPYGCFSFDGPAPATLKSDDARGNVIYMGTFAKSLIPGLRVGYLVADMLTSDGIPLAQSLAKVKSFLSVNTSPITQAMVGGILIQNDFSLTQLIQPKSMDYARNRDAMLTALAKELRPLQAQGVTWNRPAGGFFLTIDLPFEFDDAMLHHCAGEYGVIVCPLRFFSPSGAHGRQIRLSFSYVDPRQIEAGIARLAQFLKDALPTQVKGP